MARALRIQRPSGRYRVTARGNERQDIFRDDTDHFHFLELLGELASGLGYAVVSKAIARFGRRLSLDAALRERLAAIQNQLSK